MIRKTVTEYVRSVKTYPARRFNEARHNERVRVETWWLFFIPLYRRETIAGTNL